MEFAQFLPRNWKQEVHWACLDSVAPPLLDQAIEGKSLWATRPWRQLRLGGPCLGVVSLDFSAVKRPGVKNRPAVFTAAAVIAVAPQASLADEGGVSFWLPGLFGSLAAVPGQPAFSFSTFYYNTNVSAWGNVARAREIEIGAISPTVQATVSAKLDADVNFVWLNPTYVFATPVLGGQASVSMGALYGRSDATLDGTLTITSPISATTPLNISSSVTGFGDLYPTAQLKWNDGVNNYMVYGTGDIPVGDYERRRLANLGIGHGAADLGAGYTYLDQKTGHEFSVTGGFTYNLENPSTHYQNGVDLHIDWAASQYLSQQFSVGVVGYLYNEIGCDGGSGDRVGCFPIPRCGHRPAGKLPVSRRRHAGLSQPEGLL